MTIADDLFDRFLERFPAPEDSQTVPREVIDEYRDRVPEALLTWWQRFGFGGFGDGLVWLCDPREWTPIAELFFDAAEGQLPAGVDVDDLVCYQRSAFGEMKLWHSTKGGVLHLVTPVARMWTRDASTAVERDPDRAIAATFSSIGDSMDMLLNDDSSAFDASRAAYGQVAHDQVYAFNPALPLAGDSSRTVENLSIQPAEGHLAFLSTLY